LNNKKISFISCVNDEELYEEAVRFINALYIPEGYEIEKIALREAKSLTSGYNRGMGMSDAKYKVYLHQDTFIIDKTFIYDILEIFNDDKVGMIGAAGSEKMSCTGIWWEGEGLHGNVYDNSKGKGLKISSESNGSNRLIEAQAIDGLIMITQYDVRWREDIFDGWDFYDVSQTLEFAKKRYKTVIHNKEKPWILHDCGAIEINNNVIYFKYKKIFLMEYSKLLFPLVSIMITAYNRPRLFREALESALNQDYLNKEIVIVDNSTNNLVKAIMIEYENIKYIRYYKNEKELKVIDNFNKAINLTKSEYICFLMDDDIYRKDKLSKMMNYFIKDEEISLVTSYRQAIDNRGNNLSDFVDNKRLFVKTTTLSSESIKEFILINPLNFLGETTTPIFKKSLLTDCKFGFYRGNQYNIISDFVTWINMSEKGKVIYIPESLSYFRIHAGQDQKQSISIVNGHIELGLLMEEIMLEKNKRVSIDEIMIIVEKIIGAIDNVSEDIIDEVKIEELLLIIQRLSIIPRKFNDNAMGEINRKITKRLKDSIIAKRFQDKKL